MGNAAPKQKRVLKSHASRTESRAEEREINTLRKEILKKEKGTAAAGGGRGTRRRRKRRAEIEERPSPVRTVIVLKRININI